MRRAVRQSLQVRTDGGVVEAVGLDVFVLAADGRIGVDYQFIEA